MQSSKQMEGGVAILRLQGRLDAGSVRDFRALALDELRAGHLRMVIDFSNIEAVDGQGLAALVNFYRKLVTEKRGRLAFSGLNPEMRQFLDRTSLSRVIPITYDSQDAAREVRA